MQILFEQVVGLQYLATADGNEAVNSCM